jgi:DNA-binding NarL/FixJ family response regulator
MKPLRILVADDHRLVRQAIRGLLGERTEWEVVAEAGDGQQAIDCATALQPDVVIIDAAMPGLNGIEAAREIARVSPAARIVMLTIYDDEEYAVEAFAAGAAGYVLKGAADDDLVRAVDTVMHGRRFVSSGVDFEMPARYVPQVRPRC